MQTRTAKVLNFFALIYREAIGINSKNRNKEAETKVKTTEKKKAVAWNVTPWEMRQITALKAALKRNTTSDLMRYLVAQEAERILPARILEKAVGK